MARVFALFVFIPVFLLGAQDRIIGRIDDRRTFTLRGPLSAGARFDQGLADAAMPISYATLVLKPAAGLEEFLAAQRDPASPVYRKWLTPEQFGSRFGLSANDLDKLTAWLRAQGLTVHDVARGKHWITFSGTAGAVGRAFHTEIHRYLANGRMHFANAAAPSIPEAFQAVVDGVAGLDDFGLESMRLPAKTQPDYDGGGTSHYLAPDDISTIFDIAPLYSMNPAIDGTGQKIAVIGQTDVDINDIHLFRTKFGLPVNDPTFLRFGPDPGTTSDLPEADIDLQWSGAVARNAAIIYAYSNSVRISALYAVDQNLAPVMTLSYGSCEPETTPVYRTMAQQANAQGITWMVSSGDSGAATCDRNSPTPQATKGETVSLPASMPEITAVGGTEFNEGLASYWAGANGATGASALSYIPEKVWNDSASRNALSAGGGGASAYFPKPVWQIGAGVPNDGARDVPDVSMPASPDHDGYLIYTGGKLSVYGGTSVGTPVFAGIMALANQYLLAKGTISAAGLGNINPALYRMAQNTTDVFHDITVGDNKEPCEQGSPECVNGSTGFSAAPGYDLASGLGSVDVLHLLTEWNPGAGSATTVTAMPANPALTDAVQLTAMVKAQGTAATPTGQVEFVVGEQTIGTAPLVGSGGVATATLMSTGAMLVEGGGKIGALYAGDTNLAGSGGTASVNVTFPAGQSAVVASISPNPVPEGGTSWQYLLILTEKAGVATTLTGFTINGTTEPVTFFNSASIPANGSIFASISSSGLNPPVNRVFAFTGMDATGTTWSQQITVPFIGLAGPPLVPSIALTSTPGAVQQNVNADPSCQWSHQLTVQEKGGFEVNLTSLLAGATNMSSSLQQILGTTRLAAYGVLQGTVCFGGLTVPSSKSFSIAGTSELGTTVTATATVNYAAPATQPAAFTVSPQALALKATGNIVLAFSSGSPAWTASSTSGTAWLTISPTSGTGPATISLTPSAAGLSPGVYNSTLAISTVNAVPQAIFVPVSFTVGTAGSTSIAGVLNGASFQVAAVAAPGMSMAVFGSNLSPSTMAAASLPLPLTGAGVSATVNGVTAPLYYLSPGQINLQVPYETSAGPAVLAINNNGQIASFPFTVAPSAPGIFFAANGSLVPTASAPRGGALAIYITGDGDLTPTLATGATPAAGTALKNLPQPRLPLTVTVGGVAAVVVFEGVTNGLAGVTQVNFTVPANAPLGAQPVVVTVGGVASAPVNLTVTAN